MTNTPSTSRSNSRHVDHGAFTSRRVRLALLTVVGVGAFAGTNATAAQAGGFDIGPVPTTTVQIELPIAQPEPQPDPQPNPDLLIAQPTPGETDPTVDAGGPVPSNGGATGTDLPSTGAATGFMDQNVCGPRVGPHTWSWVPLEQERRRTMTDERQPQRPAGRHRSHCRRSDRSR